MSSSNVGPVGILDQVGIDVADLDRAARFWTALLGLKEVYRGEQYLTFDKQGTRLDFTSRRCRKRRPLRPDCTSTSP